MTIFNSSDDDDWSEWRYNSFRVAMRGFYLDYDSEYNVIDYEGSEKDAVNNKVSDDGLDVNDEDDFKKIIDDSLPF